MDRLEIIKKLEDDNHYYGEFGSDYISNSNIKPMMDDIEGFCYRKKNNIKQTKSTEMLFGNLFHHIVLEPHKVDDKIFVDVGSRNTKKYKEAKEENNGEELILLPEYDKCLKMADKLLSNKEVFDLVDLTETKKEVPEYGMILDGGMYQWKGKADIVNEKMGLVIDLKTTSSLDRFYSSSRTYNYDSQSYIYRKLFNKEVVFVVMDKNTFKIGIVHPSDEAYERGEEKVRKAEELYYNYVDPNGAGLDASQHLIKFNI
jgi:hypothetical protein